MRFIKLTFPDRALSADHVLYVNTENIIGYYRNNDSETHIDTIKESRYLVKESPEEILGMINGVMGE